MSATAPFPLFARPEAPPSATAEAWAAADPTLAGNFVGKPAAAARFLHLLWFPRSQRWRYPLSGKTGTTYTLQLLFWLEFGSLPRVQLRTPANHHPELAIFSLRDAGLLSNSAEIGPQEFAAFPGLSLATIRNPYTRAMSGFRYLCRSQVAADQRFVRERLRLNALTGFDWDRDSDSLTGFRKFLDYIAALQEQLPDEIDAHWRPQVDHIQPQLLRPDLIGAIEDMPSFATALIAALGPPSGRAGRDSEDPSLTSAAPEALSRNTAPRPAAASEGGLPAAALADPEACALIRQIYADDFACFGYDQDPALAHRPPSRLRGAGQARFA